MRIITGKWKGHKLLAPPGCRTRPTSDRVREGIFSIIGNGILDARFLDVFAGSGGIGLEALSRGARQVVFIENNQSALKYLRNNIAKVNGEEHCIVKSIDGFRACSLLHRENLIFDMVYMDPPFFAEDSVKNLEEYFLDPVVSGNGMVILEHFHKLETPGEYGKFIRIREVRYGDSCLSIYRQRQD